MEGSRLTLNNEENDDGDKKEAKKMDLDTFLDSMGKISKHQLFSAVAVMLTICLGVSMMSMSPIFLSATPDHRCALPGIDEMENMSHLIESFVPLTADNQKYDSCHRYAYNLSVCKEHNDYSCVTNTSTVIACDQGYYYDRSIYTESAVTQWDLVCDRAILDAIANSLFFFGFLLGALFSGILSDRYGRRRTMLLFCLTYASFGVGCSFAKNFVLYVILRIGVAASTIGSFVSSLNYVGEISNRKWRVDLLLAVPTVGAIGSVLVAIIAYCFRDWKDFQMACSLMSLTYIPVYLLTVESPRWLLSKGKEKQAKAVILRYSRSLGVVAIEDYWQLVLKSEKTKRENEGAQKKYSFADLFKHRHMRLLSFNIMFSWAVGAMVYYGLVLNIGNLAGDPYANTAINSSMDVISGGILYVLFRFASIRILVFATFLLAGFSCLGSMLCLEYGFVPASVILACLGRLGISGCLKVIIVLTSEVYPTVTRGIGVGLGSMSARIGSITSPFTLQTQLSYPWLMQTIFGCLSIIAGIASLFYPDTSKAKLLTSIEETEMFLADSKPLLCTKRHLRHDFTE